MKKIFVLIYLKFVMKFVFYIRFLQHLEKQDESVLFINHFYTQDFKALRAVEGKFHFSSIDAPSTFGLLRRVFKPEIKSLWHEYDNEDPFVLQQVRSLMDWFVARIKKKIELRAIIIPNDNYFWIREFIHSCRESGVKSIMLDKEGMISPYHFVSETKRYKRYAPPICDYIFVWSDRKKRFWIECGVPENRIIVTGMARSDLLKRACQSENEVKVKKVSIFTYHLTAYIPHEEVSRGLTWKTQRDSMHRAIKNVAELNPKIKYKVKCHPQQVDVEEISQYFEEVANVDVLGGSSAAMDLISESDYIVCFQSTVMIEAMILSKPVIYAGWSEIETILADKLLPFRDVKGIIYVMSEKELEDTITDLNSRVCYKKYDENEIFKYIFNPDGKTSERIIDDVERLCKL